MIKRKNVLTAIVLIFGFTFGATAQRATVTIQQDSIIPHLLELKTSMANQGLIGDRYKIQIFSGDNNGASETIKAFRDLNTPWKSTLVYDTPNYKVWVGNFRNKLEADRALLVIEEYYPAAFKFRPERK